MNFYNEIDPYCCDWLENLIREQLIPAGVVDRRSIVDIVPHELTRFTQCHFFAGLGGWPLALRRAGYPDHRAVWTGSCPCQPFSQAGKRLGFADDRHLWPYWRYLIAVRRPATIFGEQVASAADWLGLVRGDLEALDYAVGCCPVEAASAGADHLRDRFWFVADKQGERLDGSSNSSRQTGRNCAEDGCFNGVALGDAHEPGSQGRIVHPERGGERIAGTTGVEHAARFGRSQGRTEHELWSGRDAAAEPSFLVDAGGTAGGGFSGTLPRAQAGGGGARIEPRDIADGFESAGAVEHLADPDFFFEGDGELQRGGQLGGTGGDQEACDWVVGADGKARRVKSGIRLLAHGVPSRVAKLRAFGNAIDPRPAAAFIKASMQVLDSPPRF